MLLPTDGETSFGNGTTDFEFFGNDGTGTVVILFLGQNITIPISNSITKMTVMITGKNVLILYFSQRRSRL